jgi:hypothetical protein
MQGLEGVAPFNLPALELVLIAHIQKQERIAAFNHLIQLCYGNRRFGQCSHRHTSLLG